MYYNRILSFKDWQDASYIFPYSFRMLRCRKTMSSSLYNYTYIYVYICLPLKIWRKRLVRLIPCISYRPCLALLCAWPDFDYFFIKCSFKCMFLLFLLYFFSCTYNFEWYGSMLFCLWSVFIEYIILTNAFGQMILAVTVMMFSYSETLVLQVIRQSFPK